MVAAEARSRATTRQRQRERCRHRSGCAGVRSGAGRSRRGRALARTARRITSEAAKPRSARRSEGAGSAGGDRRRPRRGDPGHLLDGQGSPGWLGACGGRRDHRHARLGRPHLAHAARRPILRGGAGRPRSGHAQPRADALLAARAAGALRQRDQHRRGDVRAEHARDHRMRRARPAPGRPGPDVRDRGGDRPDVPVAPHRGDARHLEPGGGAVPLPAADLPQLVAGVRRTSPPADHGAGRELRRPDPSDVRGADRGAARGRLRRTPPHSDRPPRAVRRPSAGRESGPGRLRRLWWRPGAGRSRRSIRSRATPETSR